MSDIQTLRSYLVGLGFDVNNAQFQKFNDVLDQASKKTKSSVANIASDILKWQGSIAGFFLTTGAAIVATMDKVAQADQKYRLLGERLMMSTSRARSFDISKEMLGGNLGAIAFDPELHQRFNTLMNDQANMSKSLGPDFAANMRQIRDIRFEFSRMQVELQYGLMATVNQIFKGLGLGSGSFLEKLRKLNDYIQQHLPEWSRMAAKYVVPFLKDAWMIAKDLWEIFKDLATAFDNFIGIITGDKSLMGVANMEKFAHAVEKVAHFFAMALHYSLQLFGLIAGAAAGAGAGAAIGSVVPGVGTVTGGLVGALIGGTGGNVVQTVGHLINRGGSSGSSGISGSLNGTLAQQAWQAATMLGQKHGIDPAIIYAQWAHESGNFSSNVATRLNNLGGINVPGGNGTDYRSFSSVADYANTYDRLLSSSRYAGVWGAKNSDQFAAILKSGGYYGDTYKNYSSGLRNHMGDYAREGSTTQINVNVRTNADPNEIAAAVQSKLNQKAQRDTQRALVQFSPAYGG